MNRFWITAFSMLALVACGPVPAVADDINAPNYNNLTESTAPNAEFFLHGTEDDPFGNTKRTGVGVRVPKASMDALISGAFSGVGLWDEAGSDIYYNGGNVGIGDSTPDFLLDLESNGGEMISLFDADGASFAALAGLSVRDSAGSRTLFIGDGSKTDSDAYIISDDGGIRLLPDTGSDVLLGGDIDMGGFNITNLGALTQDNALTQVLVRDATGALKRRDAATLGGGGADNLGNHTATQDLDLDGNGILGVAAANDDALTRVAVFDINGDVYYRTAASIAGVGGATSGVIDFDDQGGVEGSGATTGEREDNWALLKTLEGQQDSNSLPIYFPAGDWYFQPTIDEDDDLNDPWGIDHVEMDAGVTVLRGAGKYATVLHFPNRWYYYIFRQRAWDCAINIEDLTITVDGVYSDTFTADASTDKLTATGHGFLTDHQYLKFSSTGTLPAPLGDDTQSSVDRVAVVYSDANTFFVKNWLTAAKVFTIDTVGDTIDIVGHGYNDGDLVVPSTNTGDLTGTGITAGTRYFVVNANLDDFQVEASVGGGAIDLTAAGVGTLEIDEVYDITTAGTGTHTLYEIGERSVLSAGYHIGATSGIDGSDGTNEINVLYDNVRFIGINPFSGVSSKGAKNLTMHECDIFDTPDVAVSCFINDTGTEGVDWRRPHVIVDSCRFEMRVGTRPPYGNHFFYGHPTAHQRVVNSTFLNCWNIGVQIQSESSTQRAGEQLVANCYFKDNEGHVIGAQAEDDRGRFLVNGCTFEGLGDIEFRSDTIFTNNFVRSTASPALTFTDAVTDDAQRKETYIIANNTFIIAGVSGANAVFAATRDHAHVCYMHGNIWRRDPDLANTTQIFLGSIGSSSGDELSEWYFSDEIYNFETTGAAVGFFIYPALVYEWRNCRWDGPEAIFITSADSDGTEIRIIDCLMDYEDASGNDQKAVFQVNNPGYNVVGRNNKFRDNAWIDNPQDLTGYIEFGEGRDTAGITAAATVYIDPSYDEFVVTGTTTIDNIEIGVTGNVAAHANSDNAEKMWTGSIRLKVPDTLTLSAAGNISNGAYTATGAEVLELFWDGAAGEWTIME